MFPIVPATGWIRGLAPIAEELGFREFVHDAAFVESPLEVYGIVDTTVPDGYPVLLRKDDMVEASGWAINPGTNKLPRLVVFSYSDRKTFIAAALVGSKRPDVAAYLHDQRYLRSGWRVNFPASFLPEGKSVLKAWVYDSDHRQFVRLSDLNNAEHVMILNP